MLELLYITEEFLLVVLSGLDLTAVCRPDRPEWAQPHV